MQDPIQGRSMWIIRRKIPRTSAGIFAKPAAILSPATGSCLKQGRAWRILPLMGPSASSKLTLIEANV